MIEIAATTLVTHVEDVNSFYGVPLMDLVKVAAFDDFQFDFMQNIELRSLTKMPGMNY